jgi:hypothetical protein
VLDFDEILDSGDRILSAVWTVTNGITTAEEAITDCTASLEAYGGTVDTQYTFQCVATTNEGRKHERSFIVMVVDR